MKILWGRLACNSAPLYHISYYWTWNRLLSFSLHGLNL